MTRPLNLQVRQGAETKQSGGENLRTFKGQTYTPVHVGALSWASNRKHASPEWCTINLGLGTCLAELAWAMTLISMQEQGLGADFVEDMWAHSGGTAILVVCLRAGGVNKVNLPHHGNWDWEQAGLAHAAAPTGAPKNRVLGGPSHNIHQLI